MSKAKTIPGQFVPHRLEMLQSPAWRSLSGPAKCVLERLEIEHMLHAGQKNGRLICTYNDFAEHGIRRKSVAPAKRQLCATGFLEITQRGRRSADHGEPAQHRLTYLPTQTSGPSDEWRDIKPNAHQTLTQSTPRRRNALAQKGQKLRGENAPVSGAKTPPILGAQTPLPEPKTSGAQTPLPSRSYPSTCAVQEAENLEAVPTPPKVSSGLTRLRARLLSTTALTAPR